MPRPITIQDDAILEAARALFLERGMSATTADIAARAQISPGILFKRFKTKQALFRAAMEVEADPDLVLPLNLETRIGMGSVDGTLRELGMLLVKRFLDFVPTMMMAWSNRRDGKGNHLSRSPLGTAPERAAQRVQALAAYLSAEARLGRVRSDDFEVVAQTFIGALWHYAFSQVTLDVAGENPKMHQQYVNGVVRCLWSGIAPTP